MAEDGTESSSTVRLSGNHRLMHPIHTDSLNITQRVGRGVMTAPPWSRDAVDGRAAGVLVLHVVPPPAAGGVPGVREP